MDLSERTVERERIRWTLDHHTQLGVRSRNHGARCERDQARAGPYCNRCEAPFGNSVRQLSSSGAPADQLVDRDGGEQDGQMGDGEGEIANRERVESLLIRLDDETPRPP